MDARIRTGASAYDQPPGAGYCPPGAQGQAAAGGTSGGAGSSGAAAGAGGTTGPATSGYSASMGDVGMSDDAGTSARSNGDGHHPGDAFREAMGKLGELKEFASYYVSAKLDAFKVTGRNLGVYAALGIVGLIVGGTMLSTAAVEMMVPPAMRPTMPSAA